MRSIRLLVLLLSLLALNIQALAAVTRAPEMTRAAPTSADVAAHVDQHMANMDCCDPDDSKQPCAAYKDGVCICKWGQNCQTPQLGEVPTGWVIAAPASQLVPATTASTGVIARSPPRLLRPPIL